MLFKKSTWYQIFKYSVYAAVFVNVILFLNKELAAGMHRFADGITMDNFVEAFTSTIDTAAWVILLILFEFETFILSAERMRGWLGIVFRMIRAACYVVIVSSFLGYCSNYAWLDNFKISELTDLCSAEGKSWMAELDDFEKITEKNCEELPESGAFYQFSGKEIFTDAKLLTKTYQLAVVDILNSLAWILIVIILEIDVWLQQRNRFKGKAYRLSFHFKNLLYFILLFAAVYWGIFGDFLEFWDAFLWIVAFFFIEMNLFDRKNETDGI